MTSLCMALRNEGEITVETAIRGPRALAHFPAGTSYPLMPGYASVANRRIASEECGKPWLKNDPWQYSKKQTKSLIMIGAGVVSRVVPLHYLWL